MPPDHSQSSERRQANLTVMLTVLALAIFLLVLIFLSGGFFLYVVAACLGLAAWCAVHYVLWGRAMTQSVAGEREEELLRRQAAEPWDETPYPGYRDHPNGIRRP
jgi:hypothetical protein